MKKWIVIILILLVLYWIGDSSTSDSSGDESISQESVEDDVDNEEEVVYDSSYEVGETVTFTSGISVTITNWGKMYSTVYSKEIMFFDVEFVNNGSEKVTLSSSIFTVYADNYAMDFVYAEGDGFVTASINAGRNASGRIYVDVNPDTVYEIEVQLNETIWKLK